MVVPRIVTKIGFASKGYQSSDTFTEYNKHVVAVYSYVLNYLYPVAMYFLNICDRGAPYRLFKILNI